MDFEGIFTAQLGLAARTQLLAAGVTPSALAWRLTHQWRLVLPGVIMGSTGSLSPNQRIMAAQLYAGPLAQVTGEVGCRLHELRSRRGSSVVQLVVPHSQRRREAGWVRISRTRHLEDPVWVRGAIRYASPARCVIDWARDMRSLNIGRALAIEAVQRRLVTLGELVHQLESGPSQGSALMRRALVDVASGAWSAPEAELRSLLASTRLTEPMLNPALVLPDGTPLISPDAWFDEVGLAVMVHSKEHHSREEDFVATIDADVTTSGVVVVGVVPRMIRTAPREVVRRILAGHAVAERRARPDILVRPRALFLP